MKKIPVLLLLVFGLTQSFAFRLDTLMIKSKAMNKEIPNIVIVPDSYSEKEEFPVLYLLHGATDSYEGWTTKVPAVKSYADEYNMIIVCPDGGYTGWYFDSPIDDTMQYETYVSKELVSTIDEEYSTKTTREGRAITGLSMGGHGAFYLSFRHQDIWGAAGSMSGGVDIRPFPDNWDIAKRIGKYSENPENWEENTVTNMLDLLTPGKLKLTFDCGTGDFFYKVNKTLHEKLLEKEIPHDYAERPGKHNWEYWANSIKYHMIFFNDFFQAKEE